MRINFVGELEARSAADLIEQHGYRSMRSGTVLQTDCPSLLTISIVGPAIGLHRVRAMMLQDPESAPGAATSRSFGVTPK